MNRLWLGLALIFAAQAQSIDQYFAFPLTSTGADPRNYGQAYLARLGNVNSLASDAEGNLYFADGGFIRRIATDGTIAPIGFGSEPLTADRQGNIYFYNATLPNPVAASQFLPLVRLSPDGRMQTWGYAPGGLDIAAGNSGDIYVLGFARLWHATPDGTLTQIAGTGVPGYSGDGGPAAQATIYAQAVAVDANGTIYLGDTGNDRVRAIDANGIIRTVAGIPRRSRAAGRPRESVRLRFFLHGLSIDL